MIPELLLLCVIVAFNTRSIWIWPSVLVLKVLTWIVGLAPLPARNQLLLDRPPDWWESAFVIFGLTLALLTAWLASRGRHTFAAAVYLAPKVYLFFILALSLWLRTQHVMWSKSAGTAVAHWANKIGPYLGHKAAELSASAFNRNPPELAIWFAPFEDISVAAFEWAWIPLLLLQAALLGLFYLYLHRLARGASSSS